MCYFLPVPLLRPAACRLQRVYGCRHGGTVPVLVSSLAFEVEFRAWSVSASAIASRSRFLRAVFNVVIHMHIAVHFLATALITLFIPILHWME